MRVNSVGELKKQINDVLISESNIGVYDLDSYYSTKKAETTAEILVNGIKPKVEDLRNPKQYRLMNQIKILGHGENVGYENILNGVGESYKLIVAIPTFMKGRTFTYYLGNYDVIDARKTTYRERSENEEIQDLWFFRFLDQANRIPKDFIVGALISSPNNEKEFKLNANYIGFKSREYQENFIERIVQAMDSVKNNNFNAYDVPRVNLESQEHIETHLGMFHNSQDYFSKQYEEFLEQQLNLHKTK